MKSFGDWFNDFRHYEEPKTEEVTETPKKFALDNFGNLIEVDYEPSDYITIKDTGDSANDTTN